MFLLPPTMQQQHSVTVTSEAELFSFQQVQPWLSQVFDSETLARQIASGTLLYSLHLQHGACQHHPVELLATAAAFNFCVMLWMCVCVPDRSQ